MSSFLQGGHEPLIDRWIAYHYEISEELSIHGMVENPKVLLYSTLIRKCRNTVYSMSTSGGENLTDFPTTRQFVVVVCRLGNQEAEQEGGTKVRRRIVRRYALFFFITNSAFFHEIAPIRGCSLFVFPMTAPKHTFDLLLKYLDQRNPHPSPFLM